MEQTFRCIYLCYYMKSRGVKLHIRGFSLPITEIKNYEILLFFLSRMWINKSIVLIFLK